MSKIRFVHAAITAAALTLPTFGQAAVLNKHAQILENDAVISQTITENCDYYLTEEARLRCKIRQLLDALG